MTGPAGGLAARAAAWRDADPDPQTRAELDQLLAGGDAAALADRFEGTLAFGTAGIRAEIGAGPMRMNRLVAGRVAAGLARSITTKDQAAATAVRPLSGPVIAHSLAMPPGGQGAAARVAEDIRQDLIPRKSENESSHR